MRDPHYVNSDTIFVSRRVHNRARLRVAVICIFFFNIYVLKYIPTLSVEIPQVSIFCGSPKL